MESIPTTGRILNIAGRVVLGLAVGASFGIFIGALVASWVYGVDAIEGEAINASYVAAAVTVGGAVVGALIGFRVGIRAGRVSD